MKRIKKFLSILLVASLLFSVAFSNVITVNAATNIDEAKSISVNSSYTGSIENGYDYEKDYYKFTTSSDGYVTVSFTNSSPTSSTSDAWDVSLLTNYAAETITSSVVKLNNSTISLTTIGLPAGTYYIRVQSKVYNKAVSINNYSIKAAFTSANNWEKEFNGDVSSSNVIDVNETYYGTIRNGYEYEADYYKLETTSDGYVTVDFTNTSPSSSSSEAWEVTLYGFSSNELTSIISKTVTTSNNKVSLTTVGLPEGIYYIRVQSKVYNRAVSNSKYGICANFTAANDWEQEFNESISMSNIIDVNKTYYGTTRHGYDYEKDYYMFETTNDGYVTVDFTNTSPSSSSNEAWTVTLYGFSSNALNVITSKVVKTNNSTISLTTVGLPKGTYYVCVQSKLYNNAVYNSKYGVCINYTTANNWEKEFNETSSAATIISTQEKYSGTIRNGYDYEKDYYKFTTTSSGTIDITFFNENSSTSTSEAWGMYVYDSTLALLDSKNIKLSDTSVGIQLTGKPAGTYYINIQSKNYSSAISSSTYKLKVVGTGIPTTSDSTKPTGSISSTSNVATSQTVTLSMSDNVGVAGYYWGTSSSYSSNTYTTTSSSSATKTISNPGTYYLTVKDTSGNISETKSITFYKTTLDANGGSVSPSYVITASGKSFTLPTPTRSGYTYSGWATSSSATSATYQPGASFAPSQNTTLYAVWKSSPTYSLTYDANGGSGAPSQQNGSNTYTISSTVPTKFGYTFLGWSKSSSTTTSSYVAGDTITISNNLTLYAVWKPASTLSIGTSNLTKINFSNQEVYYTFNPESNGTYTFESTGSVDSRIYVYNTSGTEIGYDDDSSDEGTNFKLTKNLTGGTKYYIKVRAYSSYTGAFSFNVIGKYTVTYNANGGSGAPSSQTKTHGTNLTLSSTKPTRDGHTFLGWSTSSSATSATYQPGSTFSIDGDTTLYAVWQKIPDPSVTVTVGDVNDDGVIDAGDAVLISRYDAGFITLTNDQLKAGDVNGDGVVDAGDAVVISRYDAGFISSLR